MKGMSPPVTAEQEPVVVDKTNVLILGPTGTGKTLMVKSLAAMVNVPLVIADATSLTQAVGIFLLLGSCTRY